MLWEVLHLCCDRCDRDIWGVQLDERCATEDHREYSKELLFLPASRQGWCISKVRDLCPECLQKYLKEQTSAEEAGEA